MRMKKLLMAVAALAAIFLLGTCSLEGDIPIFRLPNSGGNGTGVSSVSLNITSTSLAVGAQETLTAIVSPSNATNQSVSWSSSNYNIASVSSNGVVTGVSAGSATITVTTADSGRTATCAVTVNAATVFVTGVSLNKTSISLTVGLSETLTATVLPSNATNKNVTWISSNSNIATVTSNGVVTGVSVGSATITVTTVDGNKTATCSVTVIAATVNVTFSSVTANGSSSQTTTALTLTFNVSISGLSASDITLSGVNGITKGSLTGDNPYTLPISGFNIGGNLTVSVAKTGFTISGSPKMVSIYYYALTNFVRIEGGTFTMGSPSNEPQRNSDEVQHQVTVSAFYMGKYQVTQAEYEAVTGTNPSHFRGSNFPVECVNWYDAVEFCNRLSQLERLTPAYTIDKSRSDPNNTSSDDDVRWLVILNLNANGYRLPTEAEWEYACRAGTTTPFSTGNNITTSLANYNGNIPYNNNAKGIYRETTTPVGSFAPNPWGLYDMHGNVWEWCWDWYGSYSSGAQTNPRGAVSGSNRVHRGGAWVHDGRNMRSATRNGNNKNSGRFTGLGFRVVRP